MPKLHIQYGREEMVADEQGNVSRPAIKMPASGQWKITGAVRLNNFGHVVERFTLADILAHGNQMRWRHSNDKQRIHICDLDHGRPRVWMSPPHRVSVENKDKESAS